MKISLLIVFSACGAQSRTVTGESTLGGMSHASLTALLIIYSLRTLYFNTLRNTHTLLTFAPVMEFLMNKMDVRIILLLSFLLSADVTSVRYRSISEQN